MQRRGTKTLTIKPLTNKNRLKRPSYPDYFPHVISDKHSSVETRGTQHYFVYAPINNYNY